MSHTCDLSMKLWGSVTVWPKGQIVIPKEVRDLLGISPWDTLITMTKWSVAVGFIKNEDMQAVMEYMQDEIKGNHE